MDKNLIINLWGRTFREIINLLPIVKECGYTGVQLSPVQPTIDDTSEKFWMFYQQIKFAIGNKLGTEEEYSEMCEKAKVLGLDVVQDVVTRHMAGSANSLEPHPKCDPDIVKNPDFWMPRVQVKDYNNRWEYCRQCSGLPALNYFNPAVQNIIEEFLLKVLKHATGLRIDMAKSISTPSEDWSCGYWNMINRVKEKTGKTLVYGEVLYVGQEIYDLYVPYCGVLTDYNPYRNQQSWFGFIESHDTYFTQESWTTKYMTDSQRIWKWNELLKKTDNAVFFARRTVVDGNVAGDNLAFSKEIRNINLQKLRGQKYE